MGVKTDEYVYRCPTLYQSIDGAVGRFIHVCCLVTFNKHECCEGFCAATILLEVTKQQTCMNPNEHLMAI